MSHRTGSVTVLLLVCLFSSTARSQESAVSKASGTSAASATREKALDLLETVNRQVGALQSAENRARIRSNLADLLWVSDEKAARDLIPLIQEDINGGFNNAESDGEFKEHTQQVFFRLRRDTVERIARHDPEAAATFLRATRPAADSELPYSLRDTEKNLALWLAERIAARNPDLAIKLGRAGLAKGFSSELLSVLLKIQRKDNETANRFFEEIVEKLKATKLTSNYEALGFAVQLVRFFPPPAANESIYRDLLETLLREAETSGCANVKDDDAPQICYELSSFYAQAQKFYPGRTAPFRRWVDTSSDGQDLPDMAWQELTDAIQEGTIDDILELANRQSELSFQAQAYTAAITKAQESGNTQRARQIANGIPNLELRASLVAELERELQSTVVTEQQVAAFRQFLTELRDDNNRLEALGLFARRVGQRDPKTALAFLDQGAGIVDRIKPMRKQLEAQLGLAFIYCSLKSERGFRIMESLLPRLNELIAAAATLDGLENHYLRDGEWNMSAESGLGKLLNALSQNAGYFANYDFDRAVKLSTQFDRLELRLMAQLRLAQSVLSNDRINSPGNIP